jgi:hypothetical protein
MKRKKLDEALARPADWCGGVKLRSDAVSELNKEEF